MGYQLATLRSRGRPGHCGLFWGTRFQHSGKFVPLNSLTMHFNNHQDPVSRATSKWLIHKLVIPVEKVAMIRSKFTCKRKSQKSRTLCLAWVQTLSFSPRDANLSLHLYQPCRPKPIHTTDGSLHENKLFITSEQTR